VRIKKVDLTWNDSEVLPDKIRPDVDYLFSRMNEATISMVDPRPGDRILDVGCGRATDIVAMSKYGAVVIGVEPSFVMLSYARDSLKLDGYRTDVLQAIGESIPVARGSIDKVVCKGALDHFADPDGAIRQMSFAIRPGGSAVIAVANFESLGFKIGKFIFWLRKLLRIRNPYKRLPWEPPSDHTVKLDRRSIVDMLQKHMEVQKVMGVSMLCSMPGWGDMLARFPKSFSRRVLASLNRISRRMPGLSDVVIVRCTSRQ